MAAFSSVVMHPISQATCCTLSDPVACVPAGRPAAGSFHSIMAGVVVVVIVSTNNRAPPSSLSQRRAINTGIPHLLLSYGPRYYQPVG